MMHAVVFRVHEDDIEKLDTQLKEETMMHDDPDRRNSILGPSSVPGRDPSPSMYFGVPAPLDGDIVVRLNDVRSIVGSARVDISKSDTSAALARLGVATDIIDSTIASNC